MVPGLSAGHVPVMNDGWFRRAEQNEKKLPCKLNDHVWGILQSALHVLQNFCFVLPAALR
jgi:hypothetical protein